MFHRKKIGVFHSDARTKSDRLLESLACLLPVEFVELSEPNPANCDAALLFGVPRAKAIQTAARGLRCLAFVSEPTAAISVSSNNVRLSSSSHLPQTFRGRTLSDKAISHLQRLTQDSGDEVLAQISNELLWVRRNEGGATLDLLATEAPRPASKDFLFQHFQRDNWAGLLPLLHFLREVSGESGWTPPPIRACFMFDDPNLHWKSYGYVNYPRLIQNARSRNYHAAFATVPLDGWYVNRKTAALFRENSDRISLLVHGNNHTQKELAQAYSAQSRNTLAGQALNRIERLEKAGGIEVSRVMAAPHGACSDEMAGALLRAGYEAACISRGSIMNQNKNKIWPASVGLDVSEFMGGGLPVIPRFRITKEWPHEVLFAAFLGQPIVPVGHHEDLADGLGLLEVVADLINSLGKVQWLDMRDIARSNFCTRLEDQVLHVKNYSRRIRLKLPAQVNQFCLERPASAGGEAEDLRWRENGKSFQTIKAYAGEFISVTPGAEIEIVSVAADAFDPHQVPATSTPLRTILRRQLCEVRDRSRPLIDRGLRKRKQNG